MKCLNCKNMIPDDSNYCPICGSSINELKIEQIVESNRKISIPKIIMSIVIVLLLIVSGYYLIVGLNSDLTVEGKWVCTDYISDIDLNDDSLYYFNMYFNKDFSFNVVSLENSKDTFNINGSYIERLSDKKSSDLKGYVDVTLTTNDAETIQYEFGMFGDINKALVLNLENYSAYFCKRE